MSLEVTRSGLDYIARWKEYGLEMKFHALVDKPGEVTAEIEVKSPTEQRVFYWGNLNLLSEVGRGRVIKHLVKEWHAGSNGRAVVDFEELIHQASYFIVNRSREGEPFLKIGRRPIQRDIPRYRVEAILPEGVTTSLFADGGTGKGWIAADIALCVQLGMDFHGQRVLQGNVGILDWESDDIDIEDRMQRIAKGYEIEPPELFYRHMLFPLRYELPAVLQWVHENDIKLIVVDSLGLALGGDINGPGETIQAFSYLRLTGCTILAIDHVTKGDDDNESHKAIGSAYKHNLSRATWELIPDPVAPDNTIRLGMFHRKANRSAKRRKPFVFTIAFDGDEGPVTITTEDIKKTGLNVKQTAATRILDEIAKGGRTPDQLRESISDVKPATLKQATQRLKDAGYIYSEGGRYYKVSDRQE